MKKDLDHSSCPQLLQDSIRFQRQNISQLLSLMTQLDATKNQVALKSLVLEVIYLLDAVKHFTSQILNQKHYLKQFQTVCFLLWIEIHSQVGVLTFIFSLQDKSQSDPSRLDKIELANK